MAVSAREGHEIATATTPAHHVMSKRAFIFRWMLPPVCSHQRRVQHPVFKRACNHHGRKLQTTFLNGENNQWPELKSLKRAASVCSYEKIIGSFGSSSRNSSGFAGRRYRCPHRPAFAPVAENRHRRSVAVCHCARTPRGRAATCMRSSAGVCSAAGVCASAGIHSASAVGLRFTAQLHSMPSGLPPSSPSSLLEPLMWRA